MDGGTGDRRSPRDEPVRGSDHRLVEREGLSVIPASGEVITAEMVRRMIDEDRDRRFRELLERL